MAVPHLSIPGYQMGGDLNFSSLAKLPETYKKARIENIREQTLADLGGNGSYDEAARRLMAAGDVEGGISLAKLAQLQSQGGGVYGTPIYGVDAQGNTVLGAIGKNGSFQRIDTGGVTPTPGGIKPLDTGAGGFAPFDPRRGTVVGAPIPKTGDISKDFAPVVGPGGVTAKPIPGTPAAREIEENEQKAAARAEQTKAGGELVMDIIKDVRDKVTSAPFYNPAVGFGAPTAAGFSGTNAADTAELIKTITANIGFDRLQRMREESPTGGALGQVAVQEIESLQKTIASLGQNQSQGQFLKNLQRVEDQYSRIIKKASAYPNAGKYGFGQGGGPPQQGAAARVGTKEQYDALQSGTQYIAPDGSLRTKR